ncbi:hypothetical protein SNEBB_001844, partial [Seison nebaliae]
YHQAKDNEICLNELREKTKTYDDPLIERSPKEFRIPVTEGLLSSITIERIELGINDNDEIDNEENDDERKDTEGNGGERKDTEGNGDERKDNEGIGDEENGSENNVNRKNNNDETDDEENGINENSNGNRNLIIDEMKKLKKRKHEYCNCEKGQSQLKFIQCANPQCEISWYHQR